MDIVINVNIETGSDEPKVEINKTKKDNKIKKTSGVVQFPENLSSSVLDIIGIKET